MHRVLDGVYVCCFKVVFMNVDFHQKYLEKSGDEKIYFDNYTENENGFCSWELSEEGDFVISQCYGNGEYWIDYFMKKAKELHCKRLLMATKRNPKAFERKYKFVTVGYILTRELDKDNG